MTKSISGITLLCVFLMSSFFRSYGKARLQDTSMFLNINGANLFVRLVGSGQPILIVHGGPGLSHDYLAPQFIELLADDYQLIFYDQRASGQSSGVEDTTRITMAQFVDDIDAIRRYFKLEKMNILGHSFGGLLAMYYAITHPAAVGKLLLLDSTPPSWEPYFPMIGQSVTKKATESEKEELAKIRALRPHVSPAMMERYFKIYFRPFFINGQLTEQLTLGVTEQWVSNYLSTYPRLMKDLGQFNILDKLSGITAPTFIIHGAESVIPVESARAIAARIPNCKLTILKDVGHFPYVEDPTGFNRAARMFFSNTAPEK